MWEEGGVTKVLHPPYQSDPPLYPPPARALTFHQRCRPSMQALRAWFVGTPSLDADGPTSAELRDVLFLLMDRVLADVAAAHEALFTPDVLAAKQFLVAVFQELRTVTPRGTPWELVLAKHLRACTPAEVGLSPYASLARSLALLTLDRARELRAREEARARAVHAARAACVAQACAQVPGWDTVFPTMADAVKHLRESGTDDRGSTAAASELKRAVTTGGAAGALKRREREPDSPPFWAALADVESLEPALMRWCK